VGEHAALGCDACLSLFLAHATPIIHEVRLCSPQQVQALFRLLLLCGKLLLCLSRDGSEIGLAFPFWLLV